MKKELTPAEHNAVVSALDSYRDAHGEAALNSLLLRLGIDSNVEMSRSSVARLSAHLNVLLSDSGSDLHVRLNEIATAVYEKGKPQLKAFIPDNDSESVADVLNKMGERHNARRREKPGRDIDNAREA
jgi:hypothetical protein